MIPSTHLNKHGVYSLRGEIRVSVKFSGKGLKDNHSHSHLTPGIDPLQQREIPLVAEVQHSH